MPELSALSSHQPKTSEPIYCIKHIETQLVWLANQNYYICPKCEFEEKFADEYDDEPKLVKVKAPVRWE